ncbi:MAG TPA: zinc ribbon domain-containing protein [Pyrinomonadaceae bacterium]|jgi:hypothetical protein|nr:zinc ribbon domain-containing protein [Pyrinomonadaceae bacterium]
MICPICRQAYSEELLFCLSDGTALVEEVDAAEVETVAHPRIVIDHFATGDSNEFCPLCGSPNKAGSRFCKKCGQPLTEQETVFAPPQPTPAPTVVTNEPRRRSSAGLIALAVILSGFFLLLIIVAVIAYNWNSGVTAVNVAKPTPAKSPTPKPTPSPTPTVSVNANASGGSRIGKTGTLATDANLRESADPNSAKVGTHYKGAEVKVLEVTEVPNDEGGTSIWYHVVVTSYGTSVDPNNAGLEKDPNSVDEGWINSFPKVWDPAAKKSVHKRVVTFDEQ